MSGSTFKRCGCKDDAGRELGKNCPRLRETRHGSWYYATRVPGRTTPLRKGGFPTKAAAQKVLSSLRSKVAAGTDLHAGQQTPLCDVRTEHAVDSSPKTC